MHVLVGKYRLIKRNGRIYHQIYSNTRQQITEKQSERYSRQEIQGDQTI